MYDTVELAAATIFVKGSRITDQVMENTIQL